MPRTRPTAKELAVDAPLEWIEERSGFVGLVEAFLFRNVPGDTSWLQTLGSSLLTVFLLQATTGVILAMNYRPTRPRRTSRSSSSPTRRRSAGSSAACTSGDRR